MNFKSIAILALVCAVVCGCSKGPKKPADLPNLNPTVVTVSYDDGTPCADAQVVFRPQTTPSGRMFPVAGTTDTTGKIDLMTDGSWKGVPAGSYDVIVTKETVEKEMGTDEETGLATEIIKSVTREVAQK